MNSAPEIIAIADGGTTGVLALPSNLRLTSLTLPALDSTTLTFALSDDKGATWYVPYDPRGQSLAVQGGAANLGARIVQLEPSLSQLTAGRHVRITVATQTLAKAIIGKVTDVGVPLGNAPLLYGTDGGVLISGVSAAVYTDDAAFTPGTSKLLAIGFQADETATDSVDEGDIGTPRMTLDRKAYVVAGGDVAHDAVDANFPQKIGGKVSTTTPSSVANADRVDAWFGPAGQLVIAGGNLAGNPTVPGVVVAGIDGTVNATIGGLNTFAFNSRFNGASWERYRTPNVFKSQSAVVITSETTVWTPTSGKKFRLMGYCLTQGALTGAITLKDNTAGTTILIIPQQTIGVNSPPVFLGNGILSAAANNVLTAIGATAETITGFFFGTEE